MPLAEMMTFRFCETGDRRIFNACRAMLADLGASIESPRMIVAAIGFFCFISTN